MSFQQITIVGNLGQNPQLRYVPSGKAVTDFSVAVNTRQKHEGEYLDQVQWFKVTAWDKMGETCAKWLQQGSHVLVVGRLSTEKWVDRSNQAQFGLVVTADRVEFLGKTRTKEEVEAGIGQSEDDGNAQVVTEQTNLAPDDDDEL